MAIIGAIAAILVAAQQLIPVSSTAHAIIAAVLVVLGAVLARTGVSPAGKAVAPAALVITSSNVPFVATSTTPPVPTFFLPSTETMTGGTSTVPLAPVPAEDPIAQPSLTSRPESAITPDPDPAVIITASTAIPQSAVIPAVTPAATPPVA